MRRFRLIVVIIVSTFLINTVRAQNAMINILTGKSGLVRVGEDLPLEVRIHNTDPTQLIGQYKIRARISIPGNLLQINASGHNLPTGWVVAEKSDSTITISNAKDIIGTLDARLITISLKGIGVGGPLTISGQLIFTDGQAPGNRPGTLNGDMQADNSSTSTCIVTQ